MSDELVTSIYSAAMKPGHWVKMMGELGTHFGADSSFMFTSHSELHPDAILLGHNIASAMVQGFREYWCDEDIWAAEARRRGLMKQDTVLIGSELVPNDVLRRSRYYNEFSRHFGQDGMLGAVLFDGTGDSGIPFTNLCWYRPPGNDDFKKNHKQQLVSLLGHLQQALKIQYKLKALDLQASFAQPNTETATLLLNAKCRIIDGNAQAQALLNANNSLLRTANGYLRGIGARSAPTIDEATLACIKSQQPVHILIQTVEIALLRGLLLPLPVEEESYGGWHDDRYYLLMLDLPKDNVEEIIERAAALFGLSGAEQRLAASLVKGLTLEQIGELRSISQNTVRTQVRSLLMKTGFTRQIDLVRTFSRLAN
ncbi:helix-turn-helix transcriptional regulator [Duganella sp. BuS-21]|uniref:helix-turn-helix transcriptional regulator n=1 Tax=Duganella sp. BuS-21 TaxID=2943848 RepID=UPI0035A5F7D5